MQHQSNLRKTLQQQIKSRKKEITIMFTDIEASSAYWDAHGDLGGRMMVDYHNRLVFPVIKRFHGRIIKTIGDAVMASLERPEHAVTAAIAIQQILKQERINNKKLPKIKIGIHTGSAIVEKKDIFGDMVNVAKRIEGRAVGDQILLSTRTARKMKQKDFFLTKGARFQPKGKKTSMTLYNCAWRKAPDMLDRLNLHTKVILTPAQKWEILFAALASVAALIVLYLTYIRFFLADNPLIGFFILDPLHMIVSHPWIAIIPLALIALCIYLLIRIKKLPFLYFRIVAGGLGFLLAFYLFKVPVALHVFENRIKSDKIIFESKNRIVQTVTNNLKIHETKDDNSEVVRSVMNRTLLVWKDISLDNNWYKILIGKDTYGWIRRIIPPSIGVPEKICATDSRFHFRYLDVYRLIFSLLGFITGFFIFKLKPI